LQLLIAKNCVDKASLNQRENVQHYDMKKPECLRQPTYCIELRNVMPRPSLLANENSDGSAKLQTLTQLVGNSICAHSLFGSLHWQLAQNEQSLKADIH
jgi:hypothetical protein